jgi:GMP synthase-like glutamine amidotransferase
VVRALVIEHDPLSTPDRVGEHLERRGVTLQPLVVVDDIDDPEVTASFPDPNGHDLVVLMGSPWSVYDPRLQGWLLPELDLLRGHLARGTPILGICFGAQTLSTALGGAVSRSAHPEYGWGTIDSRVDEIAVGPWFQFHHDEFTLPDGATELARNQSGLQSFRVGRSLAVQFHPEMTSELIASWCAAGGDSELIGAGVDPDQLIEESGLLAAETQPALERMLDWWLDEIAG